jgi:hypothetical protein
MVNNISCKVVCYFNWSNKYGHLSIGLLHITKNTTKHEPRAHMQEPTPQPRIKWQSRPHRASRARRWSSCGGAWQTDATPIPRLSQDVHSHLVNDAAGTVTERSLVRSEASLQTNGEREHILVTLSLEKRSLVHSEASLWQLCEETALVLNDPHCSPCWNLTRKLFVNWCGKGVIANHQSKHRF